MSRIFVITSEDNIKHKDSDNVRIVKTVNSLDLTENDVFVSYVNDTVIDMRLEFYDIPAEALCVITKDKDVSKVLENEEYNYEQDYYLFSGQKIKDLEIENKKDIIRSMKTLAKVMYQMLDAGYLSLEDNKKIDDWILSFEEPTLKLLNNYLKFETSNPNMSIEDEFLINPQFRRMILINIMKILANYIVNNDMITVEEVAKHGTWLEEKTWYALDKKLKLLKRE